MSRALLEAPGGPWTELSDDEPGDHPARLRLKVTDTSGNNQLSLLWGIRSRYYDSSATAKLFYEAEALTPINGAAVTGLSGASGGDVVTIKSLPAASWAAMLVTTISATTGNWTHQGSYRVWARCYSATGTPQFQLLWGVGSLSVPVTNTSVTLPGSGAFYLLDLGEVRIDALPVGINEWLGAIQVYSAAGGDSASVDCIYLQPLDDGAGQLTYVNTSSSPGVISATKRPGTGANNAAVGTVAWYSPTNIETPGSAAYVTSGSFVTEYLEASNFGFSVPSSATIVGIGVSLTRYAGSPSTVIDHSVVLVKGGTLQSHDEASAAPWTTAPQAATYGGSTDLWGASWAYSDINSSGFGVALAATCAGASGANVQDVEITVYYTLASGFTVSQDAVIYGDQTLEIRYDQMVREGSSGTVYGPVSQVTGDLARLPPSGLENRPCQIFIKPTRGNLDALPDDGLDSFTVQPVYSPCWIFRP